MTQQYPGPQQQWGPEPTPPKKRSAGKTIGIGCLSFFGVFILIIVIVAVVKGGNSKSTDTASSNKAPSTSQASPAGGTPDNGSSPADNSGSSDANSGSATDNSGSAAGDSGSTADTVTVKVWGSAPAGVLGGLDITYGSDTENLKGTFTNGKFEATFPLKQDAMYEQVNAQLQGEGDIQCSVTIGDKTKSGHAQGGYNICSAQLNGFGGDWN